MRFPLRPCVLFVCIIACGHPSVLGDFALQPVAGEGALEDYYGTDPFDPNNTSPELKITGEGAVENSGGVDVFYGKTTFILELQFLDDAYNNEKKPSFTDLLLTAAFRPNAGAFEKIRFFNPDDPSEHVDAMMDEFVDADLYGLIFPPDGIRGIANGAGDFLSLNGSLITGVGLGVGLQRDKDATSPPTVRVGVKICEPDMSNPPAIRFDVFGLNQCSPYNIMGNDPNSGAAGYLVPEPMSIALFSVPLAVLARYRRRRKK